jgi:hypothetical protein
MAGDGDVKVNMKDHAGSYSLFTGMVKVGTIAVAIVTVVVVTIIAS